jgi:hypothetical protein
MERARTRADNLISVATIGTAVMMMSRLFIFATAAILLASAHAPAQAACQPTISEPCTPQAVCGQKFRPTEARGP